MPSQDHARHDQGHAGQIATRPSTTYNSCLALPTYVGGTHPNVHVLIQAFEVTVVSARDQQNERWLESAKETEGVDVDSVFQRFPHGVKIMLQAP